MATSPLSACGPVLVPSLTEAANNTTVLDGLPLPVLLDLRRQLRHLDAEVDVAILRQMAQANGQDHQPGTAPDRLLTPEEAAGVFSVKKRWLLDHADDIPGVRRLSRKTVRFSERGLGRYLSRKVA